MSHTSMDKTEEIGYGPALLLEADQPLLLCLGDDSPYHPSRPPMVRRRRAAVETTVSCSGLSYVISIECSNNECDTVQVELQRFFRNVVSTRPRWIQLPERLKGVFTLEQAAIDPITRHPLAPGGTCLLESPQRSTSPSPSPIPLHLPPSQSPIVPNISRKSAYMLSGDARAPGLGLINLGNTCYASSMLQILISLPPFIAALHRAMPTAIPNSAQGSLAAELIRLAVRSLATVRGDDLDSPIRILTTLNEIYDNQQWKPGRQQDAHEFLIAMLHQLHHHTATDVEVDDAHARDANIPADPHPHANCPVCAMFRVPWEVLRVCPRCGSANRLPCNELSVTVVPKSGYSVSGLIGDLMIPEPVAARCDHCRSKQTEIRRGFVGLPPVLIVHISRMGFTGKDTTSIDIDEFITFADGLEPVPHTGSENWADSLAHLRKVQPTKVRGDLTEHWTIDDFIETPDEPMADEDEVIRPGYQLHAVVCHQGDQVRGHYIVYINTATGWVQYNDQQRSMLLPKSAERLASMCVYKSVT